MHIFLSLKWFWKLRLMINRLKTTNNFARPCVFRGPETHLSFDDSVFVAVTDRRSHQSHNAKFSRPKAHRFGPMTTVWFWHVRVSRQKRFRAKTDQRLFSCRSAGTITTITADIWGVSLGGCVPRNNSRRGEHLGVNRPRLWSVRVYFDRFVSPLLFPVLSDCFLPHTVPQT